MKKLSLFTVLFLFVAVLLALRQVDMFWGTSAASAESSQPEQHSFDPSTGRAISYVSEPVALQTGCVPPPPNMVAWYPGDGNANDIQGNAHGALVGGATATATGMVVQAFRFDGVAQSVALGNPASLRITGSITIDAWIFPTALPPPSRQSMIVTKFQQIVGSGGSGETLYSYALFLQRLNPTGQALGGFVYFPNGTQHSAQVGNATSIPINAWTHVAMTFNSADGQLTLFINGQALFSIIRQGSLRSTDSLVSIGKADIPFQENFFPGLIDEVEIFNRALTFAEVQSIFNAGPAGKCKPGTATPTPTPTPTPSPTPTPACTYRFRPSITTVGSFQGQNRVDLETQAGCNWTIDGDEYWLTLTETSGSGPKTITYGFSRNDDENMRTADISVRNYVGTGGHHYVTQEGGACPTKATRFAGIDLDNATAIQRAKDDIGQFYDFRDDVLSQSQRGQKYIEDYYLYAGEITKLMIFSPRLFFRTKDVLERYRPVLESVLNRTRARAREITEPKAAIDPTVLEPTVVYDSELDDIDDILSSFGAEASGKLRETLDGLRRDVRDPQVQADFGVRIEHGEKRPLHIERQSAFDLIGKLSLFDFRSGLGLINPFSASRPATKTPEEPLATAVPMPNGDAFGKISLSFEANQGQVDKKVKYLSRGAGYNLFLTPTEAVLSLPSKAAGEDRKNEFDDPNLISKLSETRSAGPAEPGNTLRMSLVGANSRPQVDGVEKLEAKSNYFVGNDRTKWRSDIPHFGKVKYRQVYKGIDLVYYGNQRQLEYDFKLAPKADPAKIKMRFDGADKIEVDEHGDLVIQTGSKEVRMQAPVSYQEIDGVRHEIASRYALTRRSGIAGSYTVGFELGTYDTSKALVIDPVLVYSTYLGGNGDDFGNGLAVDGSGNAYIIGYTDSTNFPVVGAIQPTYGGNPQDIFVSKVNAAGTALVYSTYLGGSGQDNGSDIAVDAAGNAYITGYSGSTNFPVANALQPTRTGLYNAFVAKLNPTGSQLVFSTYYGGTTGEYGSAIAVDPSGNAYVGGVTSSANFPRTANALQTTYGGSLADAFVTKFNPAGNQVVYSTFLGGDGNDGVTSIAIDPTGNAYVTGVTFSTNFPTASPQQATFRGGAFDAFVTKINPTGTAMGYSTYLGGTDEDRGFRVELDAAGNAYVAGMTQSTNFPVVSAFQPTNGGGSDAFITKLSPAGAISYSTFLGGSGLDGATGLAVNPAGTVYMTGFTTSPNFPLAAASQASYNGGEFDAFAVKLNAPGTALNYSTYLGGAGYDTGFDIVADTAGNGFVLGRTASTNFPLVNPLQATNRGLFDIFITKFDTSVSISGRVTTPNGIALRNATVALTDSLGVRRTATTSSFGIYSFANVRSGENYIVGVSSKRYRFSPQALVINQNLANVDFVGLE